MTMSAPFLPLSVKRHLEEIRQISEKLSLSEKEKSELEARVRSKYYHSFAFHHGVIFEYRSVSNRLLRGKGVFFFSGDSIGCVIVLSLACIASRHYERYHIFLQNELKGVLKELINDRIFRKTMADLSTDRAEDL